MAEGVNYADLNYKQNKSIFDSIANVFNEFKLEKRSPQGWNTPVEEVKGMTLKFLGENFLEVTYHSYEVSTPDQIALKYNKGQGHKLVDEVGKELKKRFKAKTKKALGLKKVRDTQGITKTSVLGPETSFAFGNSRPVTSAYGKFLVRCTRVYEFSCNLET